MRVRFHRRRDAVPGVREYGPRGPSFAEATDGRRGPSSGFSLLELVLAMAVFSLLMAMVFTTARTSLQLSNRVIKAQNETMLEEAFFGLLNRHFTSLPGNTVFDLVSEDSGSHYLSDMTFQEVPIAFSWGGTERIAQALVISPELRRDGYLDVVLSFYEDKILEGTEDTSDGAINTEPFAEVVLLEDVRMFEWRVLDGRTLEWEWDWDIRGRMPLQVELTMAFGAQGDKIRQVFWIPPKQNPEVLMRQLQQGGGGSEGGQPPTEGTEPGDGTQPGTPGVRPGTGGSTPPVVRPGTGGGGGRPGGGRPGGGRPGVPNVNVRPPGR